MLSNYSFLPIFMKSEGYLNSMTKLGLISTLYEKCRNTEFFLVHIFLYSVRIQENTDWKKLRIWILFTQWLQSSIFSNFNSTIEISLFQSLIAPVFIEIKTLLNFGTKLGLVGGSGLNNALKNIFFGQFQLSFKKQCVLSARFGAFHVLTVPLRCFIVQVIEKLRDDMMYPNKNDISIKFIGDYQDLFSVFVTANFNGRDFS